MLVEKVEFSVFLVSEMVVVKYRVVVKGAGMVYDGDSEDAARRKFNLFVRASKKSKTAPREVTLFKDYEIVKDYQGGKKAPPGQRRRPT